MMRVLIDAQLPRQLIELLAGAGIEASHVFDHLPPDAPDTDVAALANRLGAAVMSKDSDFLDLVARELLDQPLIHVRLPNLRRDDLLQRVDLALPDVVSAMRRKAPIVEIR